MLGLDDLVPDKKSYFTAADFVKAVEKRLLEHGNEDTLWRYEFDWDIDWIEPAPKPSRKRKTK